MHYIIFLRKIVRGGTDESYGIHVARLAGVPKQVTTKANEILGWKACISIEETMRTAWNWQLKLRERGIM